MLRYNSIEGRRGRLRTTLFSIMRAKAAKSSIKFALGLALSTCVSYSDFDTTANADDVSRISERETPTVLAIRRCSSAVVNIHGQKTVKATAASMAGATGDAARQVNGMGTGVVIDPRGYVITNYHVVEDVDQVQITLADGTTTTAEVVAAEVRSDLALLKVNVSSPLDTIPRGTSSDLMVGEPVIAIGNAFGYVHTATEGIVSALHRDVPVNDTQEYRDLIQTSAGINPGNSGGPLLNIYGEIIGVNVAVRIGAQQIAFAIPIDQAIDIVSDMISSQNEDRLSLGMRTEGGPKDGDGVVIAHVAESSPAFRQGLKTGDRIVAVGEFKVDDRLDFGLSLIEAETGEELPVEIEREGKAMQVALKLDAPSAVVGDESQALAWSAIGVKLQPVPKAAMQRLNSRTKKSYRGGLYVTEVRKGSPADIKGIRSGDVLIGLHGWSTASIGELRGILSKVAQQESTQGQFLIIRSDQTMFGYLQLAETPNVRRR